MTRQGRTRSTKNTVATRVSQSLSHGGICGKSRHNLYREARHEAPIHHLSSSHDDAPRSGMPNSDYQASDSPRAVTALDESTLRATSSLMRSEDNTDHDADENLVRTIRLVLAEKRRARHQTDDYSSASITLERERQDQVPQRSPARGCWIQRSRMPLSHQRQPFTRPEQLSQEDPRDEIIRQLTRRLERVERDTPKPKMLPDINLEAKGLFSKRVQDFLMPRSLKLPQPLKTYNGIGDPNAFIRK